MRRRRRSTNTYVDLVGLSVVGYGALPEPEHIEEGWGIDVGVGDQIDRAALQAELQEALDAQGARGYPYELQERYTLFSWGADAASIIIVVGTTLSGLAGAVMIAESIAKRLGGSTGKPSKEESPELVQHWLGRQLQVRGEAIRIDGVDPIQGGFRVTAVTPYGRYTVDVLAGSVYRMRKMKNNNESD